MQKDNNNKYQPPTIALAGIIILFVSWPYILKICFNCGPVLEINMSSGEASGFNNLYSPLGVLLTGLNIAATVYLIWAQSEHAKTANQQGEERLSLQKDMLAEDKFHNRSTRNLENIFNTKESLLYYDKGVTSPEGDARIEIRGAKLLIEAGLCMQWLIDNLEQALDNGINNVFVDNEEFSNTFMKRMEMCFQLFAACSPWMGVFVNALEDIVKYGDSFPAEKAHCVKNLQNNLTRYEKMLIGAFSIAVGRDESYFEFYQDVLFENTRAFVADTVSSLLKTYELYGDGEYARCKIIEDISGYVPEEYRGKAPENFNMILEYIIKNEEITIEKACELTKNANIAKRMLNMALLLGWFEEKPSSDISDNNVSMKYCLTQKIWKFI